MSLRRLRILNSVETEKGYEDFRSWTKSILHCEMAMDLWEAGMKCGGLDENVPHGLLYLNTCSPGGGAVWRNLGGLSLLKAIDH